LLLVIVIAIVVWIAFTIRQVFGGGGGVPVPAEVLVPITGPVAVLSDGVTIVYSDPAGLCRMEDLTASETPARVALALREQESLGSYRCPGWGRPPGPVSPASLAITPPGGPAVGYTVVVQLTAPLGRRVLLDGATGRAIPAIDQRSALRLAPTAEWGSLPVSSDYATSVPFFGGPGAAVLAQYLLGLNAMTRQPDGRILVIVQVADGGWHPPAGTATTKVRVRGQPGLAAPGIIVWPEAGRTIAVIGQGPASWLRGDWRPPPPLPLADLLAIAAKLTRG
jgi:hypothetical protein